MTAGDITRSTFRPAKHYSGVRMQQGRVQLDADWNEQLDITAYRDHTEVSDAIGPAGAPKADAGFAVTVSPDQQDLLLSAGRAWVGGRLCEVGTETTEVTERPTARSVTVASLVLDGSEVAVGEWVDLLSESASVATRVTAVDVSTDTVTVDTSLGSLSGALRLRRRASYAVQPDLPAPEHTTQASATAPRALGLPDGAWLAYLDVWEREISALEDPAISEPALGVDTATRSQVVWQVRLLDLAGLPTPVTCDSDLGAAVQRLDPPTGRMAARAEPPADSADLCRPTPAGGYVGLENQLYRVHVHDLDGNRPVVCWSRENATVATRWLGNTAADILDVATIGRDAVLGFQPGDWVELYDDGCVLDQRPGTLVQLTNAKGTQLFLDPTTASDSTQVADFPRNPHVRRWDSEGAVQPGTGWLELENGVQVRFPDGGTYRRHDYWLVPARNALADVDWPTASGGEPLALLPHGVRHDVGRLAIVTKDALGIAVADCRDLFPSLTTLAATDVAVDNDVCLLPGVETVQDAIDALCRANDLPRHNRLLHGYGIVCGLAVHCGDDEPVERPVRDLRTADRRLVYRGRTLDALRDVPSLRDRFDFDRLDLDELRAKVLRRTVRVDPGCAIDADGNDLELTAPVVIDVLAEAEALGDGAIDANGDGELCLVLRSDPDGGPVVAATTYQRPKPHAWLDGTILKDIYDGCIDSLFSWVTAQLNPVRTRPIDDGQRAYQLRTALTNLLTYVANPKSGGTVYVSDTEHQLLVKFYKSLKKRLRSQTFCAMFDDARPYPDYPDSLRGLHTISGLGWHSRVRVHPSGREAWTTGGGINPLKPTTMLNRYSLADETLLARIDPVAGKEIEPGESPATTAAPVTDVAFSPDGKLVYAAVPTRDHNDTLFLVGKIGAHVQWRPLATICGVKLVTLATTEADPDNIYAVALKRTTSTTKAFSLREFTGAGIFRIPAVDVPDALTAIPGTENLNTVGHLVVTPRGEAVFTCGGPGQPATSYDRLVTMNVPGLDIVSEIPLDGTGSDDLTVTLSTDNTDQTLAWTVVASGASRSVAAYVVSTGEAHARVPIREPLGLVALQAVRDRILLTESDSSLTRVLDCSRHEFLEQLRLPVQVAPTSSAATFGRPRQVVVLNQASNSLTAIDLEMMFGDSFDLEPLLHYRRDAVEAFADLVGRFAQYLKDCICDQLLVRCPPEPESKDLDLAVVSIRGGSVYRVCNFSRRRYVKSFPTVGYWLSMVPVIPYLREVIGKICCALLPEYFGRYSTSKHDEADDRFAAGTVLRFLETVQSEDAATRLRRMDLGLLRSFLKGVNEGDWGEEEPPSPPPVPTPPPGPGPDIVRPRTPEILLRNLLRNPRIREDIRIIHALDVARESSPETAVLAAATDAKGADVGPAESKSAGAHDPDLQALVDRVATLETQLAALQAKPTTRTTRTRKTPPS